jgi:hypothetical protein
MDLVYMDDDAYDRAVAWMRRYCDRNTDYQYSPKVGLLFCLKEVNGIHHLCRCPRPGVNNGIRVRLIPKFTESFHWVKANYVALVLNVHALFDCKAANVAATSRLDATGNPLYLYKHPHRPLLPLTCLRSFAFVVNFGLFFNHRRNYEDQECSPIYQFWHTTTSSQPSSDNERTSYLREELREMNESQLVNHLIRVGQVQAGGTILPHHVLDFGNHHHPGPGRAAAPAATAKVDEDDDDDLMSIDASVGTKTVVGPTDPASEAFLSLLLEIITIALSQRLQQDDEQGNETPRVLTVNVVVQKPKDGFMCVIVDDNGDGIEDLKQAFGKDGPLKCTPMIFLHRKQCFAVLRFH